MDGIQHFSIEDRLRSVEALLHDLFVVMDDSSMKTSWLEAINTFWDAEDISGIRPAAISLMERTHVVWHNLDVASAEAGEYMGPCNVCARMKQLL